MLTAGPQSIASPCVPLSIIAPGVDISIATETG